MTGWPAEVTWSDDGEYRYVWRLSWDEEKPPLLVAGLICSTSDEKEENLDPTVKYCLEIAKLPHPEVGEHAAQGYGELMVVNMFARYKRPNHKRAAEVDVFDLVGDKNDHHIGAAAHLAHERGGTIVAAWGVDGWSRHGRMCSLLSEHSREIWCLGTEHNEGRTKWGFPNHPAQRGAIGRQAPAVRLKRF